MKEDAEAHPVLIYQVLKIKGESIQILGDQQK